MPDPARLVCVTVTYHPNADLLRSQLLALPATCGKVIVDNGTPEAEWTRLQGALQGIGHLDVIRIGDNIGLAAALNTGATHARDTGRWDYVLLLDQDSEPDADAVQQLLDAHAMLASQGGLVGAVGPALRDPVTGRHHGFHCMRGGRWRRIDPDDGAPVRCDSLNGSGTLMSLELFHRLGGLDDALFIDHVDTEWSFRMTSAGYTLHGVPAAAFSHRMGEHSVRIWLGGWRVWPVRTPRRHRYLFRNSVTLLRRPYVPRVWKLWAVPKLVVTWAIFTMSGPSRISHNGAMLAGVIDGVLGRLGRL